MLFYSCICYAYPYASLLVLRIVLTYWRYWTKFAIFLHRFQLSLVLGCGQVVQGFFPSIFSPQREYNSPAAAHYYHCQMLADGGGGSGRESALVFWVSLSLTQVNLGLKWCGLLPLLPCFASYIFLLFPHLFFSSFSLELVGFQQCSEQDFCGSSPYILAPYRGMKGDEFG